MGLLQPIASQSRATTNATNILTSVLHHVNAGKSNNYDVYTVPTVKRCAEVLATLLQSRNALVVTTPTVAKLFAREIYASLRNQCTKASFMVLHCTEATKTVDQALGVCERARQVGLDRTGLLIGVGGGVCTDIVTVAASLIRRSVGYIRVPTTLVGQVDAGIGIKGAVNFSDKKSYLGCFHPPRAVVITPPFLDTLSRVHLREGFAEIIKMAVIRDQKLFEILSNHSSQLLIGGFSGSEPMLRDILARSIVGMLDELQPNIYEDLSHQRLVDFGHTFSPALEVASHYSISHGNAVAIDMALSAVLATEMGIATAEVSAEILRVLLDFGLPIWCPFLTSELCQESLREVTLHRGGQPNLVVPQEIGRAVFTNNVDAVGRYLGAALATLEGIGATRDSMKQMHREVVVQSLLPTVAPNTLRKHSSGAVRRE